MSRATAILCAQEGTKLILTGRGSENLNEIAQQTRHAGSDVMMHCADLTNEVEVDALVKAVVGWFDGIDCFGHCAGGFFSQVHDVANMDPAFWHIMLSAGFRGRQDVNSACAAVKAGMIAAVINLARELYPHNIRAHAICPGIIWGLLSEDPG